MKAGQGGGRFGWVELYISDALDQCSCSHAVVRLSVSHMSVRVQYMFSDVRGFFQTCQFYMRLLFSSFLTFPKSSLISFPFSIGVPHMQGMKPKPRNPNPL